MGGPATFGGGGGCGKLPGMGMSLPIGMAPGSQSDSTAFMAKLKERKRRREMTELGLNPDNEDDVKKYKLQTGIAPRDGLSGGDDAQKAVASRPVVSRGRGRRRGRGRGKRMPINFGEEEG